MDAQVKCIKEFINTLKIDQFALFAYYQEDRNLGLFKRLNQLQIKIYNIENLGINIENLDSPYFFVLNQDCKIEHVFIPNKTYIELTTSYLKFISKYLTFSQKTV